MPTKNLLQTTETISQKIRLELVNLLYKQIKPALLAEFIVATALVFVLWDNGYHFLVLAWYFFIVAINCVPRYCLVKLYAQKPRPITEIRKWQYLFTGGVLIGGISWGLAGSVLMPTNDLTDQVVIMMMILGVCAGACALYSPIKNIYLALLLPAILPLNAWLVLQQTPGYLLLALCGCVYILAMIAIASYSQKLIIGGLRLRYENKDLIEAKKLLETTNSKLIAEVKEHQQTEKMLETLATYDILTGLANRNLFHSSLSQAVDRSERSGKLMALLFLDLDNFKKINDTLGHDNGDKLLVEVGKRLKNILRKTDLVARIGGDEFTIVLEELSDETEASILAEKLCQHLAEPFKISNHDVLITTSIGISLFPIDCKDSQSLIRNADIAMYRAKESGRNVYQFYTEELNRIIQYKRQMEANLRKAIKRNEFILHYQPQINIHTLEVIGAEVLLRWQHPELGYISPTDFIPVAEEIGLIIPIGEWVLHAACSQQHAWQKAGYRPIPLSINISARQFNDQNLALKIAEILDNTQTSGRYLDFEITESMLVQNIEHTMAMIKTLKELGVTISIDDFGTGYSSLSYLKRFPISSLKIDRSFIAGTAHNAEDIAIIQAIIALAHSLKLLVIAEGVETLEQLEMLRKLECDIVQGYYFSKPVPATEFISFLTPNS